MSDQSPTVLPVDDPSRPSIRRAVFGALGAVAVFLVFTATKEMKSVYNHAPWLNDPYDTFISFTMFFVPLVAAFLLVQVSLCLRSEPLSVGRVVSILRACRVAIGAIIVELLSAWLAMAVGANESQWTLGFTSLEVGLLLVTTVIVAIATVRLAHAPHLSRHSGRRDEAEPDWIGDAVAVAQRESRWLGSLRRCAIPVLDWCDRTLLREVRRHPLITAAVASAGFGVAVFGWQGFREGYAPSVMLLSMGLGFCGMFAFLVPAGSYFRLVRSANPSFGLRRRALDASVVASGAAIVALACRDNLWGIIGSNGNAAGLSQLVELEAGAILLAFTGTLMVESIARFHTRLAPLQGEDVRAAVQCQLTGPLRSPGRFSRFSFWPAGSRLGISHRFVPSLTLMCPGCALGLPSPGLVIVRAGPSQRHRSVMSWDWATTVTGAVGIAGIVGTWPSSVRGAHDPTDSTASAHGGTDVVCRMHHGKMTLWGKKKTPPAQWFTDPANPSRMRWWDGSGWTEHCAPIPPGDRAADTPDVPAARVAGRAVSVVVARPAPTATDAAPVPADEDPSDILRRMLREMEWTDPDKWPLDEQVEVVGEQFYAKEIRKLFVECGLPITAAGVSVENEPCFLVPEPWNPHDPNAVAVMVRKYHVGHLPADLARRYHPRLIAYAQRRQLVTGVARVWSRLESGAMVRARVTIVVPEIAALLTRPRRLTC